MKRPTRALLLAAGFGSRMLPMTRDLPKPMMPLGNQPLIGHMLTMLASWGVRDVLVNLHYLPGPLFEYLTHIYRGPVRIHISFEPEILGTGGALRRAQWFADDAPLWMLNTDILAAFDPASMLHAIRQSDVDAALWMTQDSGPRTVELDASGCVRTFRSTGAGGEGTYTFCGVQLLHPQLIDRLPARGFSSIITAYEAALANGKRIIGCPIPNSRWSDLGTPERYLAATTDKGTHSQISPAARLHPKATIERSVIWPGATLGPHAYVRDTIVCRNVHLDVAVDAPTLQLATLDDAHASQAARLLGWEVSACACSVLPGRGSDRSFLRLACGSRSVLVTAYGTARPENDNYAGLCRCLRDLGLPVPAIIAHDPHKRLLILEDLGCTDLLRHVATTTPKNVRRSYEKTLDVLARLQAIKVSDVPRSLRQPPFNAPLYKWEHDLFLTHLCDERLALTPRVRRVLERELATLRDRLLQLPHHTLVHRDFQSTNILIQHDKVHLIDFQGIRAGCAAYDAVSLLYDPYVMLDETLQGQLLEIYLATAPPGITEKACRDAACQRLVQALGAFARLAAQPATRRFERHVAPAAAMLLRALGTGTGKPALRSLMTDLSQGRAPC